MGSHKSSSQTVVAKRIVRAYQKRKAAESYEMALNRLMDRLSKTAVAMAADELESFAKNIISKALTARDRELFLHDSFDEYAFLRELSRRLGQHMAEQVAYSLLTELRY